MQERAGRTPGRETSDGKAEGDMGGGVTREAADLLGQRLRDGLARRGMDRHTYGGVHVHVMHPAHGPAHYSLSGYLAPACALLLAELLEGAPTGTA